MEDDFESASYLSELIDSYNDLCGDPYAARNYAESKGGEPPEKIEDRIAMMEEAITLKEEELNLPLTYPEYASNKNNESPSSEEAKNNTSPPSTGASKQDGVTNTEGLNQDPVPKTEESKQDSAPKTEAPKQDSAPKVEEPKSEATTKAEETESPSGTDELEELEELDTQPEEQSSQPSTEPQTEPPTEPSTEPKVETSPAAARALSRLIDEYNDLCNDPYATANYMDELGVSDETAISEKISLLKTAISDKKYEIANAVPLPKGTNVYSGDFNNNKIYYDEDSIYNACDGIRRQKKVLDDYVGDIKKISQNFENIPEPYNIVAKDLKFDFDNVSDTLQENYTNVMEQILTISNAVMDYSKGAKAESSSEVLSELITVPADDVEVQSANIPNPFEMANNDPLSLLSADISTFTTPATIPTTTPQPTTPVTNPTTTPQPTTPTTNPTTTPQPTTPATNPTTTPQPTTPATNPTTTPQPTTPATNPTTTPQPTTPATNPATTPQPTTPATNPTTTPQPTTPVTNPATAPYPTEPTSAPITSPAPTSPSTENSHLSNNVSSSKNEKFTFTNEITNNDTTQKVEKVDSDAIKNNESTSYSNDKVFAPTFTTIPPVNNNTGSNIPVIGASAVALALAGTVGGKFYIDKEQKKDKEKTADQEKSKESQNENENLSTKSE